MPTWPWRKPRPGVDDYGRSPLWHQAMQGDLPGVTKSLKAGADATAADKDGLSSLHIAAEYGHGEVVRALIAAGADANVVDRHGNGPLWVAARRAREPDYDVSIVAALLGAGADWTQVNKAGRTPPGWADGVESVQAMFRDAGYTGDFKL